MKFPINIPYTHMKSITSRFLQDTTEQNLEVEKRDNPSSTYIILTTRGYTLFSNYKNLFSM